MTTSSPVTAARTSDSSARNPAIAAAPAARQARPLAARSEGFARRFVSALMRSLAAPHI